MLALIAMYHGAEGVGLGVGAIRTVMSVPDALLLRGFVSLKGWPAAIAAPTLTAKIWSPTVVQMTFQLRVTCTGILAGRLRPKTVTVRAFGDVQPGGRTRANVASTTTLAAGPLL